MIRRSDSGVRGGAIYALLAVVAAVVAWRAASLAAGKPIMRARSEREFFAWAYRDPGLRAKLEKASQRLRPNEAIAVEVAGDDDPAWIGVMARYYFPRQRILSLTEPLRSDQRGATRVIIGRDGPVRIVRTADPPAP